MSPVISICLLGRQTRSGDRGVLRVLQGRKLSDNFGENGLRGQYQSELDHSQENSKASAEPTTMFRHQLLHYVPG